MKVDRPRQGSLQGSRKESGMRSKYFFPYKPILSIATDTLQSVIDFYFLYIYSCSTSMCNPVGDDRLKHLYIQKSSLALCPLAVHFCAVSLRLIHDIWELIDFLISLLTPIRFIQTSLNHPAALLPPDHSSAPIPLKNERIRDAIFTNRKQFPIKSTHFSLHKNARKLPIIV